MSGPREPRETAQAFRINGMVHEYEGRVALAVESLTIGQGDIVGLVGPNGSGKSTLLRILSLVEPPTRGSLLFLGREVDHESAHQRRSVSMLLQDTYLLKRSVFENVAYGLRIRKDTGNLEARVGEALDWVGLAPDSFSRRSYRALSGGEAQRVALAARLILKPAVLLLDEPTASVDTASARLIREAALRARQEWGTTLVIASHDRAWLDEVADRTIHLFQGRIRGSGTLNLLDGPWIEAGQGLAAMELAAGLRILVAGYTGQESAASIDPKEISILVREPDQGPGQNILPGQLLGLSLGSGGALVLARVSTGGLSLTAALDSDRIREMELFPGQEVWLAFSHTVPDWL